MLRVNASAYVRIVVSLLLVTAMAIDGQPLHARGVTQPPPTESENDMVCWTTTGSVFYISDVFNAGQPQAGPRGRQGNQIGQLFLAFLQKKYGLTAEDHAICGGPSVSTMQAAQAYKQQQEDRAKEANKKIVETGWKKE